MTFRSRPAPKPTRRRSRRDDTRRAIYITISFTLAIAAAMSMLGGVFVANYYKDHWAPAASVNGQTISFDAVRARADMNVSRYQRQIADYTLLRNQAKITSDEFTSLTATAKSSQDPQSIYNDALTQLKNELILQQWADKNNVHITDADVDAQVKVDATIPELRHVMVIGVQPQTTPPANTATSSEVLDAYTRAQALLAEVKGGKKWADVATESNQDQIYNGGSLGDLGLDSKDSLALDPDMVDAVFALKNVNDVTSVFKGADGIFRFATVTSIVPSSVDNDWQSSLRNGGEYRNFARAEALSKAVQAVVEAKYISGPTVQRRVSEIAIAPGLGSPGDGDEVRFRLLVFAPSHSESNASNIATTDPAWNDAKTRADAAVATLKADPSKFATMVSDTNVNDDTLVNKSGGKVPWLPQSWFAASTSQGYNGLGMPSLVAPLYADGVTVGQVLGPIQESTKGWVVVIFDGRRHAPAQRIADVQFALNSGVDFATEAENQSDAADASLGGDMGWVTKYMLTADQEQAIFSTPVGRVTNAVAGNGYWVYKIVDQQTRVADADTQAKLKKLLYPRWLTEIQATALIWTDTAGVTALAPPSATP